jgi:L-threonate 2-dehydrogenase
MGMTDSPLGAATAPVALIGLGAMGLGMARSLRRAGHVVHACDARAGVAAAFVAEAVGAGLPLARAFETPAEAVVGCDVVLSVVVNAAQTEAVLFGRDAAAARMKPGSVFVMCSTVAPGWSEALEARLADQGLLYLDAPISGGQAKAEVGQITMMTAGRPAAFDRVGQVLDAMAAKVYRLGDKAGAGSKVKIVNQLLAGVHIAAAAEAMALGLREGVDPALLYEVITHSAGNSWMFENRMTQVLDGDYAPKSAVDIFVKDLGLVLDAARASSFPLPIAAAAHQQFLHASAAGHGREGDAAVIKTYPGIALPPRKGSA